MGAASIAIQSERPSDVVQQSALPGPGLPITRDRMRVSAEAGVFSHLRPAGRESQSKDHVADDSLINFSGPRAGETLAWSGRFGSFAASSLRSRRLLALFFR